MDKEVLEIVRAMNKFPGIETVESCCGHGLDYFKVFFRAKDLDAIPPLVYHFDHCHSDVPTWSVDVYTDCVMSPAMFCATSQSKGATAYAEANKIARKMNHFAGKHLNGS